MLLRHKFTKIFFLIDEFCENFNEAVYVLTNALLYFGNNKIKKSQTIFT